MLDFLVDDPILIVFIVIGLGAGAGSIRYRGFAVGPAAALFVGLAVGAIDESVSGVTGLGFFKELGLVLFTYTVGLASGPTFFVGLRRGGGRTVAVTIALIAGLAGMCALAAEVLGLSAAERAGLFSGSTTNTPSLQAAVEAVSAGDPGRRLLPHVPVRRGVDARRDHPAARPQAPPPRIAGATGAAGPGGEPRELDGACHPGRAWRRWAICAPSTRMSASVGWSTTVP